MPYYPPRSALAIGAAISGGTPLAVLFNDATSKLDDDANFTYDAGTNRMFVGNITVTGDVRGGAGGAGDPAFKFGGDPDTGVFNAGANQIGFAAGGTQRASIDGSTLTSTVQIVAPDGAVGTPGFKLNGEVTGMFRRAAGELNFARAGVEAIRVSATAFQIRAGKLQNVSAANEQTTVGAAGGASALPATPVKYLQILDSGTTTLVVPLYNP